MSEYQRLRHQNNGNHHDDYRESVEHDCELQKVRERLEKATVAERLAKVNLEKVLEDNYAQQELILRLEELRRNDISNSEEIQRIGEEYELQLTRCRRKTEDDAVKQKRKNSLEEDESEITKDLHHVNIQPIKSERNALKETNEKLLRLISEFVKMSFVIEQKTNGHISSSLRSSQTNIGGGSQQSPLSVDGVKSQLSDNSDERSNSAASATDEGVEVSRNFPDCFLSGQDIYAECEEAAKEASAMISRSFEDLFEELQSCENKRNEAEKSLEDKIKKNEFLEEKLEKESSSVKSLSRKLEATEADLLRERTVIEGLRERLTAVGGGGGESAVVQRPKETVAEWEREMNVAKELVERLQETNHGLEEELREKVSIQKEMKEDNDSIQSKLHDQLLLISSLRYQLDEQKLTGSARDIRDAKESDDRKEIVQNEEKELLKAKEKQIFDLMTQLRESQNQNSDFLDELEHLRTQISVSPQKQADVEMQRNTTHRNEVGEMKKVLAEKEVSLENLKLQLQSKQNECNTLTESNRELKRHFEIEVSRLKRDLEDAKGMLDIQTDDMSAMHDQLEKRQTRIRQMTQELASSEDDLARLRQEKDTETSKMETEILRLNTALGEEKFAKEEKTFQVEALERDSVVLRQELDDSARQKKQLMLHIEDLEADVKGMKKQLNENEAEKLAINETLESLRNESLIEQRHLVHKMEEMKRRYRKETQDLIEVREVEMKTLHAKEIQDLTRKIDELKSIHKNELENLSRSKAAESDAIRKEFESSHRREVSELLRETENRLQTERMKETEDLRREREKDLEQLRLKHQQDIEDLQKSFETERQKQIRKLQNDHRNEISDLDEELNGKQKDLKALESRLSRLSEEKESELDQLRTTYDKQLKELRHRLELQNDKNLEDAANKYEEQMEYLREQMNAAQAALLELKNNAKERDDKLEIETQQQIPKIEKKQELTIDDLKNDLGNQQKLIHDQEKRVSEDRNQRERDAMDAGFANEDGGRNRLKLVAMKDCDKQMEAAFRNYQREINALREELLRERDHVTQVQRNHDMELERRSKEMSEARTRHRQEMETLRTQLEKENEEQFRRISGKYEKKFDALKSEMEKRGDFIQELERPRSRKYDGMEELEDTPPRREMESNGKHHPEVELLRQELDSMQKKLNDQKLRFSEERLDVKGGGDLSELKLTHSKEIEDLKRTHQRILNDTAAEYKNEMSDLRRKLCKSSGLLRNLHAEHSRELVQLRAELDQNRGVATDGGSDFETSERDSKRGKSERSRGCSDANWTIERQTLLDENEALRRLIRDCVDENEAKEEFNGVWRTEVLKAFYEVLSKQLKRATASLIHGPHHSERSEEEIRNLVETKLIEQEDRYANGLDLILSVDRKSMLIEINDLRKQIKELEQDLLNDNKFLSDKVNSLETRFHKKLKRLKNQLNSVTLQLAQERHSTAGLQSTLEAEKLQSAQLKVQLGQEREASGRLKDKLSKLEAELVDSGAKQRTERNRITDTVPLTDLSHCVEHELLRHCERLKQLIAKYRSDLSNCSILRDVFVLDGELTSVCCLLNDLIHRKRVSFLNEGCNFSCEPIRASELKRRWKIAEEHRWSLVYQKRYLLLLIGGGGIRENERTQPATLIYAVPSYGHSPVPSLHDRSVKLSLRPLSRFRRTTFVVTAVERLRCLVNRWNDKLQFDKYASNFLRLQIAPTDENSSLVSERLRHSSTSHRPRTLSTPPPPLSPSSPPHGRSRTPDHPRTASLALPPGSMSRSWNFGSERLSLVYSHHHPTTPRSPNRRDDYEDSRKFQVLSNRSRSADFTRSRKQSMRPVSSHLW